MAANPVFERIVTAAEAGKRQITIPAAPAELFRKTFGKIARESEAKRDPRRGLKTFHATRPQRSLRLKLVLRNPPRNELRLYFNQAEGLSAKAGEIVHVQFRGGRAYIGVRKGGLKRGMAVPARAARQVDAEDETINAALYSEPQYRTQKARRVPQRQLKLVKRCLERARYKCEAGYTSPSFVSARYARAYAEVHHFLPLHLQKKFRMRLDSAGNLFALSPFAHRAIHLGERTIVRKIIDKLLKRRPKFLQEFGVTREALYELYGCQ